MYTYLLLIVCTLLSFIPFVLFWNNNYKRDFKSIFITTSIIAIPFLIWDVIFTHIGIWGFNDEYLIGIKLLGLPIEEILFFWIIPFASIYVYYSVKYLIPSNLPSDRQRYYSYFLSVAFFAFALLNYSKTYTFVNFVSLGTIMFLISFEKRKYLITAILAYLITLIPFFIVNGILTSGIDSISSNPVVWYNNQENISFRLGTIPFEDAFYGFMLIVSNIGLLEHFFINKSTRD